MPSLSSPGHKKRPPQRPGAAFSVPQPSDLKGCGGVKVLYANRPPRASDQGKDLYYSLSGRKENLYLAWLTHPVPESF